MTEEVREREREREYRRTQTRAACISFKATALLSLCLGNPSCCLSPHLLAAALILHEHFQMFSKFTVNSGKWALHTVKCCISNWGHVKYLNTRLKAFELL